MQGRRVQVPSLVRELRSRMSRHCRVTQPKNKNKNKNKKTTRKYTGLIIQGKKRIKHYLAYLIMVNSVESSYRVLLEKVWEQFVKGHIDN